MRVLSRRDILIYFGNEDVQLNKREHEILVDSGYATIKLCGLSSVDLEALSGYQAEKVVIEVNSPYQDQPIQTYISNLTSKTLDKNGYVCDVTFDLIKKISNESLCFFKGKYLLNEVF